jgi:predicted transcriptional regulator
MKISKSIKIVNLRIKRQMTRIPKYLNVPKSLLKKIPELKKFYNLVPDFNYYLNREYKFEFNIKSRSLRCLTLGVEPLFTGIYKKVIKLKPYKNSSFYFTTKTERPVLKMSTFSFFVTNEITFVDNKGFVFINEVKIFVIPKNEKKLISCGETTIWMDDGNELK